MTKLQQIREFCKREGITFTRTHGVPMFSKFIGDSVEVATFDNIDEAFAFCRKIKLDREDGNANKWISKL